MELSDLLSNKIDNLKNALPPIGKQWIKSSSDELASKIRWVEAIIRYDPKDCNDAKEMLVEALHEAVFSTPWSPKKIAGYSSVKKVMKNPPPYIDYQISYGLPEYDCVELCGGDIINLPCFGINLLVNFSSGTGEILASELTDELHPKEDDRYVASMRAIEVMVLGHALMGIDVCDEGYVAGIEAAVEECSDFYG